MRKVLERVFSEKIYYDVINVTDDVHITSRTRPVTWKKATKIKASFQENKRIEIKKSDEIYYNEFSNNRGSYLTFLFWSVVLCSVLTYEFSNLPPTEELPPPPPYIQIAEERIENWYDNHNSELTPLFIQKDEDIVEDWYYDNGYDNDEQLEDTRY